VALNERRTQVRRLLLRYEASGFFEVQVKADGRDSSVFSFTSFGPQESGVFSVPILSDGAKCAVELLNSTARPCRFIGAEWTGRVTGRARLMR
jgi:predicted ATP-grasp superfamily ATP-dependent carboligase